MQLSRTKFRKFFILSTKKWIKCFPWKNPVDSRGKSGDITWRPPLASASLAAASPAPCCQPGPGPLAGRSLCPPELPRATSEQPNTLQWQHWRSRRACSSLSSSASSGVQWRHSRGAGVERRRSRPSFLWWSCRHRGGDVGVCCSAGGCCCVGVGGSAGDACPCYSRDWACPSFDEVAAAVLVAAAATTMQRSCTLLRRRRGAAPSYKHHHPWPPPHRGCGDGGPAVVVVVDHWWW